MRKTLIATLDSAAHLTPDEIVKKISAGAWIRPRNMTQEYWDANQNVPHVYWLWNSNNLSGKLVGGHVGHPWFFNHCSGNMRNFVSTLDNLSGIYWIIALDQFDEGKPPPCLDPSSSF